MLIVTLFTTAKVWKQLKGLSTDEWIKNVAYIYIHTHTNTCVCIHTHTHTHRGRLLCHKKNEILPSAATYMELEGIILSEISQTEKDRVYISLTCGI